MTPADDDLLPLATALTAIRGRHHASELRAVLTPAGMGRNPRNGTEVPLYRFGDGLS